MNYRKLGKTDLVISEIGFGCQSIGGGVYYKNNKESVKALLHAFDSGINFFDTSDHYSQGESEKIIGKTFRGKRDKIIIATKAGTSYTPIGNVTLRLRPLIRPVSKYLKPMQIKLHLMRAKQKRSNYSKKYLVESVERSLKRLGTDYIDLFQLHKPSNKILEKGDFIEVLKTLKKQGKIRYFGISCLKNEDAFACFKFPEISSVQVTINLLDNNFMDEILKEASENKFGLILRNPRGQGLLTNDFGDIMAETYVKNNIEFEEKKEKAKKFSFLINENRTLAQASLQFALSLKGVSTVLPRVINSQQIDENIKALDMSLSEEEVSKIYAVK